MLEINLPLLSRSLFCHDGGFVVTVVAAASVVGVGVVIAVAPTVVSASAAVVVTVLEVNLPFLSRGLEQD